MRVYPFANPRFLDLEDKLHDLKIKELMDISKLYEFVLQFDEYANQSFDKTTRKLNVITSHLNHWGQEIANLEGSHDDLQKEIKSLKVCLDERDEAIVELCGVVEFLTNKRCWCNNDKVSPCC